MGKRPRLRLALRCAALSFLVLFVSTLLVMVGGFLLSYAGIIYVPPPDKCFLNFLVVDLLVSSVISLIVSHILIMPLLHLMEVSDKIAKGDYTARISPFGVAPFPQLCERFNHMASCLERAADLRDSFVNNFSHEFKTPIVSIQGFAKALKWKELSPAERDEYLDIIIEESHRLSDLAENVLNMSRAENQATPGKQIQFDLSEELRQSIAIIDSRWSEKEIDFVLDGKEVIATGNPQLLRQVWLNLLDNAVKFSPQGGTVEVIARQMGGIAQVTVADRGVGMTPEVRQRAFEKFYQGDPSRSTKGNGLGLPLVKRIVELHGGTVEARERPGGGSEFVVTL